MSSGSFPLFLMAAILGTVYVRALAVNSCHQMCTEEKNHCNRDCLFLTEKSEADKCENQCSEDMSFCYDRCNNMIELDHAIPEKGLSKDEIKNNVPQEQPEGQPLVSDSLDVNIAKLSSEKIFAVNPISTLMPPSNDANTESNGESQQCTQLCASAEENCEIECFIQYHANNFQDSDCTSKCKANKDVCLENCSVDQTKSDGNGEDFIVATPNQVTNLGVSRQTSETPVTDRSVSSLDAEINVLQRILRGLPTSGTRMIGHWVR
jgi:hypothetical protein